MDCRAAEVWRLFWRGLLWIWFSCHALKCQISCSSHLDLGDFLAVPDNLSKVLSNSFALPPGPWAPDADLAFHKEEELCSSAK